MPAIDELLVDIHWEFGLNAPEDKTAFLAAVKRYQTEITHEMPWWMRGIYRMVHRGDLSKSFGSQAVVIVYEYAIETDSGEWRRHRDNLTVKSPNTVTVGDVLYALHHQTNGNLVTGLEPSVTLEAFERVDSGKADNAPPQYDVFFGD